MTAAPTLDGAAAGTRRGSDFAALMQQVKGAGLLDRRRGHYVARIGLTVLAFAAVWTAFAVIGNSWWQLAIAAGAGLVSTQLAFLGHDGGHQQICKTKRGNDLVGLLVGVGLVGLSYGWWLDKHNRHHANPNHEGRDPDIGESVLAFTTGQAESKTGFLSTWVIRNQAWLFFPMLAFEGIQLHVASVRSLFDGTPHRYRRSEFAMFALHFAAYFAALFIVLPPGKAVAFLAVHQAVFGIYMGSSFAPNHKGMPIIAAGDSLDYLRRQVLGSRNVRGGAFTDLLLGGLNYQIEHHLFPNMPRPALPAGQKLVRQYCEDNGISYTETSFVGSYAAALTYLHALGEPLRKK